MRDADKPNKNQPLETMECRSIFEVDDQYWQVLARVRSTYESINLSTGEVSTWLIDTLVSKGAKTVEGVPSLKDRLQQYDPHMHTAINTLRDVVPQGERRSVTGLTEYAKSAIGQRNVLEDEYQEEVAQHEVTKRELKDAHNTIDKQAKSAARARELMSAAGVHRDTPIEQIEKLIDERDEWEDLVMQVREALGFPRTGYCAVVDEVRKLKEAQSDQVIKLQEYIKTRDEHWNKVCEAVGLPGQGRTDEEKVAGEVAAMVESLSHHAGYCDVFSEDIERLAEIADAVEDLCPEDTEPEDFVDQWQRTTKHVQVLKRTLSRHRDVMRQVAHIAGSIRVVYFSTDTDYEVCDYDDMLQRLGKLKEAAEEDDQAELIICLERHRRQVLEVLEATHTYPRMTGSMRTTFNAYDDEAWTKTIQQIKDSDPKRVEEMDEALEQSLMEIAQQAGVIAELRDELKRAQNSIDDLMYDAANLNGQKEAYERALQIIGGAR